MSPENDRRDHPIIRALEEEVARLKRELAKVANCTDKRCSLCAACCAAVGLVDA
jgi:hypothetical protein